MVLILVSENSAGIQIARTESDIVNVAIYMQEKLLQHGMLLRYKLINFKFIHSGLVVTEKTVWHLLKLQDPQRSRANATKPSTKTRVHKPKAQVLMLCH